MSQFSLSGSQSPDCGDQDPYQLLDDLRHAAMENAAKQRAALDQEKERLRRELNEMHRDTEEGGPPLPQQPEDIEKWAQEIQESTARNKANVCKLEGDLHEAHITCKIVRQRVQAMLKDVAEVNQSCDELANFSRDSDDDEVPGGSDGNKGAIHGLATGK